MPGHAQQHIMKTGAHGGMPVFPAPAGKKPFARVAERRRVWQAGKNSLQMAGNRHLRTRRREIQVFKPRSKQHPEIIDINKIFVTWHHSFEHHLRYVGDHLSGSLRTRRTTSSPGLTAFTCSAMIRMISSLSASRTRQVTVKTALGRRGAVYNGCAVQPNSELFRVRRQFRPRACFPVSGHGRPERRGWWKLHR